MGKAEPTWERRPDLFRDEKREALGIKGSVFIGKERRGNESVGKTASKP